VGTAAFMRQGHSRGFLSNESGGPARALCRPNTDAEISPVRISLLKVEIIFKGMKGISVLLSLALLLAAHFLSVHLRKHGVSPEAAQTNRLSEANTNGQPHPASSTATVEI